MHLKKPIAIFDSGLGSYNIVKTVHEAYPKQDIIYFADRKNFPYGGKTIPELKNIIEKSIKFLENEGANFIVLASNSPSITVLDKINYENIIGIYPPIKDVISDNKTNTLVLGAKVMTESIELKNYIKLEAGENFSQFHPENGSELIKLIENRDFITNKEETEKKIRDFLGKCKLKYGKIDSITLSSTHFPWLSPYFKKIAPQIKLYDPADKIIKKIKDFTSEGSGKIFGIFSESQACPAEKFLKILSDLDIKLEYKII